MDEIFLKYLIETKNMNLPNNLKIILLAGVAIGVLTLAYYVSNERKKQVSFNLSHTQDVSQAPIAASIICPPTVTDIDNNTYKTVKIGSQCWMKENLKVTKNPEGKPITRYCYNNDPKICDTDGGLYDWNTAMDNSAQEGAQGICPDGWHVPKDSEWYVLENYLTDDDKSCISDRGGIYGGPGCFGARSKLSQGGSSGFDAIIAGRLSYTRGNKIYFGRNEDVFFWSSTKDKNASSVDNNIWVRYFNKFNYDFVHRLLLDKANGLAIRCLKD